MQSQIHSWSSGRWWIFCSQEAQHPIEPEPMFRNMYMQLFIISDTKHENQHLKFSVDLLAFLQHGNQSTEACNQLSRLPFVLLSISGPPEPRNAVADHKPKPKAAKVFGFHRLYDLCDQSYKCYIPLTFLPWKQTAVQCLGVVWFFTVFTCTVFGASPTFLANLEFEVTFRQASVPVHNKTSIYIYIYIYTYIYI